MTNTYPDKNPFPYQGTMTVEASAETDADESYQIPRTLRLDPVRKTLTHINNYLGRFGTNEPPQGHFVALRGDHGSGKTHALKFAIDWVKEHNDKANPAAGKPAQLYAQSKTPDFLLAYKQLVSQILIDELQELNMRFLGIVASEQIGQASNDADAKDEIAAKLRANPSKIFELFNSYLVEKGAVQDRQQAEVQSLSVGGGDDFRHAFSYILSPELGSTAYNWLISQPISEAEARRLGVSGAIKTSEAGVLSLQLLAALFDRIKRPLIIYLDQYEKLILSEDKTLAAANAGLLHSLVELVPKANGMIVLAGNEEAWDALPRDLRGRFAGNLVDFPVLKPDEALEMIRLYLTPPERDLISSSSDATATETGNGFYPFEEAAAKNIVGYSAGNIRRLLQICSKVFEVAAPEKRLITTALVDKVLEEGNLAYYSYDNVRDEIERILVDHSLKFVRASRVGGLEADLAVVDNAGNPLLLIQISEATFHEQEAQRALATLSRVQRIRQQGIQAPIVFVALGYVSNEVTKAVREFVQDVVIYKPELLAGELGKILRRIESVSPAAPDSSEYIKTLEAKLSDLSAKLEEVRKERKAESDVMDSRLAQFFERQAVDRIEERRQTARPAWAEERRRLEKEIHEARQGRKGKELQEMERLRERAEKDRRRRSWLQASMVILVWLVVFVFGVWVEGLYSNSASTVSSNLPAEAPGLVFAVTHRLTKHLDGIALIGAIFFGVLIVLRVRGIVGPALYRELTGPVTSTEELDRLANQYSNQRKKRAQDRILKATQLYMTIFSWLGNPFPLSIRKLLRDPNPHYKYAGVIASDPEPYKTQLIAALKAERSEIVRRAIAQRLGPVLKADEALQELSPGHVQELAYIMDSGGYKVLAKSDTNWPRPLNILAILHGAEPLTRSRNLAVILAGGSRRGPDDYGLFEAFRGGIERVSNKLAHIPEVHVREALRALSPFDEGGLGTFDELNTINRIDEFYLFFRQLLFFMERDLLSSPSA